MGNSGRFVGTLLACFVLCCAFFLLRRAGASPGSPEFASADQVTHDGMVKTAVVSDGSSLYVAEEKHGHQVISKIVPATGEESTVSAPFPDVRVFDVSPDHTRLLASPTRAGLRSHELWTIPLGRVPSARLADLLADDAAFSPNGEQISFIEGSEIFIASSAGKNLRKLSTVKGRPFSLRFSPDGSRIRFSVSDIDTNTSSLWEMASDGANLHQLLPDWTQARVVCCGVWSADGSSYIFQATESNPTTVTTLWALPEAGNGQQSATEPVQLTGGPMSFGNPWPGADGKKIWALGVSPMGEIVQFDIAHQKFSQVLSGISATDLDFSPDGQWVAYVSIPDGTLWRSRADGSDRLPLTRPPQRIVLPRWAPDNKTIAYVTMKTGAPSQIMLVSLDGGKPSPMRAENRGQIDANWSADGKKILYGDVHGSSELSIHLLDLNRHEVATIPGQFASLLQLDEIDVAAGLDSPRAPVDVADILSALQRSQVAFEDWIVGTNHETPNRDWRLSLGPKVLISRPGVEIVRAVVFNHRYHHRAQLTVYLRMLGVPVPPIYGPSGDVTWAEADPTYSTDAARRGALARWTTPIATRPPSSRPCSARRRR